MTTSRKDGPPVILGHLWDEPVTVTFLDGDVEYAQSAQPDAYVRAFLDGEMRGEAIEALYVTNPDPTPRQIGEALASGYVDDPDFADAFAAAWARYLESP